jgi:hypothetical protein
MKSGVSGLNMTPAENQEIMKSVRGIQDIDLKQASSGNNKMSYFL